jgi:hypothetical protein
MNVLTVNKLTIAVGNLNPNVTISNNSATLLTSSIPIALKNNATFSGSIGQALGLEELKDITVVDKQQNSTVSYSDAVNKYEIKQLTLDGGSF